MIKNSRNATINKDPSAPGPLFLKFRLLSATLDDWLNEHAAWTTGVIILAALILRLVASLGTYLNPDEALHYVLVHQASPLAAYRASLTNAHPPLYFLFLYFWQLLGNSEWFLRLPSVVTSTVLIAIAGRWLAIKFGNSTGLAAMLIIAFSPTLVALGAEVRGYSMLLLWLAMALYCLERAFQRDSVRWVILYSTFLILAILTHYSALWFTISLGLYVLLRILDLPSKARIAWAAFQIGAACIYAILYKTQISHLQKGELQQQATEGWLRSSYYQPGLESPLAFFERCTVDLFQFMFAQPTGGRIALALFLASIVGLIVASFRSRGGMRKAWTFAVLLALPFGLTAASALVRLYPYGGTRHDVFLILFAVAGVSLAGAAIAGRRQWPILAASAIVFPVWCLNAIPMPQSLSYENQRRTLMREAVDYIHTAVDPGSVLFVDYQTSIMVGYYLDRNGITSLRPGLDGFLEASPSRYRVIVAPQWSLNGNDFAEQLSRLRSAYHLQHADKIWVFDAGWGVNILSQVEPGLLNVKGPAKSFGESISVFRIADGLSEPPKQQDVQHDGALRINAGGASYTDALGHVWAADTGYSAGDVFPTTWTVLGTATPALYQDERYSASPFRYQLKVPNGEYRVVLKFAEISKEQRGERLFHVAINGQQVLTNFDVYAAAGGGQKAVDREFPAMVKQETLTIEFIPVRSSATISAIEVIPK